jgi:hypothetical protein
MNLRRSLRKLSACQGGSRGTRRRMFHVKHGESGRFEFVQRDTQGRMDWLHLVSSLA